ncbi:IPT/TIG domain-containing protein [Streptomyces sp. NPDC004783]|uniref:IPT/TIG domain-containing protein n=1 Tax=Streptomyces sp. NPDC004783 TaxID=3154459 RepID=UPI0033A5B25B
MPISPNQGSTGGGTLVTITGTNLSDTSQVLFGNKPATGITQVSPTQVTAVSTDSVTFGGTPAPFSVINATTLSAVTPPGTAGAVDVVVTNPAGSDTATGAFTYVAGPGI